MRSSFDAEYNFLCSNVLTAPYNASSRHFPSRAIPVSHDNFSIRYRNQLICALTTPLLGELTDDGKVFGFLKEFFSAGLRVCLSEGTFLVGCSR